MTISRFISFTLVLLALTACTKDPLRIVCVGDSITEGAGHQWQSTSAYPFVLNQILGEDYAVLNNGRSGTTALIKSNFPYWKCKEISNTFAFQPDIITIKLGTNDTKEKNWNAKNFALDIQALIDTFNTIESQPEIILCLPAPAFKLKFGIRDSVIVNSVIPILKERAKINHLRTIDLYTPMLKYPQFFKDGIHPNEEGAKIIAEIIAKEIA